MNFFRAWLGASVVLGLVLACSSTSGSTSESVAAGAGGESSAGTSNEHMAGAPMCDPSIGEGGYSNLPHEVNDPACGSIELPAAVEHQVVDTEGALICENAFAGVDSCKGEGPYVAFRYDDSEVSLFMMFDPELVQSAITDSSMHEHFRSLWYQVTPPDQPGPKPVFTPRIYVTSLDDIDLFQYADGRLHLKLSTTSDRFARWVAPQCNCFDTDVGDDFCRCDYARALPIAEDLDLTLAGL